jgi:hypothetical protein
VAAWTSPSAPRATGVEGSAFNPVQAWATLVGDLVSLQREAWENALGATRPQRPTDN